MVVWPVRPVVGLIVGPIVGAVVWSVWSVVGATNPATARTISHTNEGRSIPDGAGITPHTLLCIGIGVPCSWTPLWEWSGRNLLPNWTMLPSWMTSWNVTSSNSLILFFRLLDRTFQIRCLRYRVLYCLPPTEGWSLLAVDGQKSQDEEQRGQPHEDRPTS